ncbi:MAG: TIGR00725 family protein [Anaerolineae bacterium]|nr:TIGR00725 family protein [Anaerolineae bacterium]
MADRPLFIAVVGSALCDEPVAALARAVGQEIARRGAVLVCGGRGGVMEAACQGAKAQGGITVGILPGADRREANRYVDIPVVTGLGEARNAIVVRSADVVIAISGGYGTLSEIGLALKMERPVIGLGTWELSQQGRPVVAIVRADTPLQAVESAITLAKMRTGEEG